MSKHIKTAPPNSLIFVSDPNGGVTPVITRESRLWSTPSCIAIGCLAFMDGETKITLGEVRDVNPGIDPAFDDMLETPDRAVVVSTVERVTLIQALVPTARTRVRIWTNHPTEPDEVIIGLG